MGAGNYLFSAPAGQSWSRMVYIRLHPIYWPDELERRLKECEAHLQSDPAAIEALQRAPDRDARDRVKESLRTDREWNNYVATGTETEFYEAQADEQKTSLIAGLTAAFPHAEFELASRDAETIEDAIVIGEVGRMVIAMAHDHSGERMAIIVTPRSEIHEIIWNCEHGGGPLDLFGGADAAARREELRDDPVATARLRRAVRTGALEREMQTVYERMLRALDRAGLASAMSFRTSSWTCDAYRASSRAASNARPIRRPSGLNSSAAL